jgi:hypothetical protein
MNLGTAFLFEIHGEEGDLRLTATRLRPRRHGLVFVVG